MATKKAYLPARVRQDLLHRLDRHAKRVGKARSALVERFVDEGLRMEEHPGIVFVEGAAGRRPALAARRGLDVWQVVKTLHDNQGDVAATGEVLRLSVSEVRLTLAYYADHKAEIDEWIRLNAEEAERLEDAWRRQERAARD